LLEVLEPGQAQAAGGGTPPVGSATVPLPKPPMASPRGTLPPSPSASPSKPDPAGARPHPFRVLLVEPDPDRRSRLTLLLEGTHALGFESRSASSLEDALEKLQEGGIDLVVIDPEKAGANAEDALIEILSNTATTPVVALLSTHDAEMAASCVRLGVEDFLVLDELDAELLARSLRYALERRRAHEARRVVRAQEGELSRMRDLELAKTRFFNAAAHEIGTPLTPIRLQIARLRKMLAGRDDPGQERALDIIDRNVQRLAQLNQDILDVARLQAGRFSIEKHPMDLSVLVREAVESFEPLAEERGITLTTACPPGLVVDGDSARLSQVVYNLVTNALKFTPRGGVVALEGRVVADECEVDVRDSGPGLAADQIAGLFQPFSQVLGEGQPRNVGTGLGLFVSRGILELHGGRIWCQSPGHGKGSTFSLALPIRPLERSPAGLSGSGAKAA
jgi:signal transduction histidine kinase